MKKGRIIFIEPSKGFGFIISPDIPFTRIYFYWSSLVHDILNFKDLTIGMEVEFIPITQIDKGMKAIKIKVINNDPIPEGTNVGTVSGD